MRYSVIHNFEDINLNILSTFVFPLFCWGPLFSRLPCVYQDADAVILCWLFTLTLGRKWAGIEAPRVFAQIILCLPRGTLSPPQDHLSTAEGCRLDAVWVERRQRAHFPAGTGPATGRLSGGPQTPQIFSSVDGILSSFLFAGTDFLFFLVMFLSLIISMGYGVKRQVGCETVLESRSRWSYPCLDIKILPHCSFLLLLSYLLILLFFQ